jgi:hypothetical protein
LKKNISIIHIKLKPTHNLRQQNKATMISDIDICSVLKVFKKYNNEDVRLFREFLKNFDNIILKINDLKLNVYENKVYVENLISYLELYQTTKSRYVLFEEICNKILINYDENTKDYYYHVYHYFENNKTLLGFNILEEPLRYLKYLMIDKYMLSFIKFKMIRYINKIDEYFEMINYIDQLREIVLFIQSNKFYYINEEDLQYLISFLTEYSMFEERHNDIIPKLKILKRYCNKQLDYLIVKITISDELSVIPPSENGYFIGGLEYHAALNRFISLE